MAKSLIKPSHRGLLHSELGIPQGQKIGTKRLKAAAGADNPVERKRAQFALNMNGGGRAAPKKRKPKRAKKLRRYLNSPTF